MVEPAVPVGTPALIAGLLIGLGLLAAARSWWSPAAPQGVLVEVTETATRPRLTIAPVPTVHAAIRAAGGDPSAVPDGVIAEGDHLVVANGAVSVLPPSDPPLLGRPVDLNVADAAALDTLPGVGPVLAERIVAERSIGGPYRDLDDLAGRVRGVGPALADTLAAHVVAP